MIKVPHHLRLLAVAFAAILGSLSMAGDVKAAEATSRECCLKRSCIVCCCEPTSSAGTLVAARQVETTASGESSLSSRSIPCECRSGDPAAPDSRQESRPGEERSPQDCGEFVEVAFPAPLVATLARLVPPNASPPRSPLYLRTERLLI
jgi:hypothetical protein